MSSNFLRRYWLFAVLALLVAATTASRLVSRSEKAIAPIVEPLPQDPHVQVFFNQSEAQVYTDPYRQITRHGDNLEQILIASIEQATVSIDIAVQALNLPLVSQALIERSKRGVAVRLILENQYAPGGVQYQEDSPEGQGALSVLAGTNVAQIDDTADGSKGSGLMHHKFLVIDRRWILTGSANLTMSGIHGDRNRPDSRGNANMLLKIDSPELADLFTQEFEHMWGDGPGKRLDSQFGLKKPFRPAQQVALPNSHITLQFSPVSTKQPWQSSVNGLISRTLQRSNQRIDMALFVFSEQRLANQLESRVRAGVALRALIDPAFIYRSYSEALDMLGVSLPSQRCQIEPDNRPWQYPIESVGLPQLPPGDKLHHKFAVIDDSTVVVGSQNWSQAANTKNDETLLVIESTTVARHFVREFNRLYRNPAIGHTPKLRRQQEKSRSRCQSVQSKLQR